jgi:hypothetical protein
MQTTRRQQVRQLLLFVGHNQQHVRVFTQNPKVKRNKVLLSVALQAKTGKHEMISKVFFGESTRLEREETKKIRA